VRHASKIRGAIAALLAIGLMVGGLSRSSVAQTQIQVLEFPGPFEKDLDLGKAGFGPGDVHLETSHLLDPVAGTRVGQSILKATVVRLHRGGEDWTFILDVTVKLDAGDLVFYGGLRNSDLFGETGAVLPVTGGTEDFAGAGGTVTIVPAEVDGEPGFMWTFDLTAG